jgi:hypothetical protein
MASTIPAASAPVTLDFMVSSGIAGTAHDRGAAHPSHPRRYWPGYWPAGGVDPWPASGYHMALCPSGSVSQLRPGVRYACLPHAEGPFSIRERASERRSPVLAAAPAPPLTPAELARWINPIVRGGPLHDVGEIGVLRVRPALVTCYHPWWVMSCANRHVSLLADDLVVSSADRRLPVGRRKTTDE